MTNRSRRSADDRAEARRRARRAAQGHEDELETNEDDDAVERDRRAPQGSFLSRLFPPAPPLPGKPDPLAGFTYRGPLRGLVAYLYLLARQPVAWIGVGAIWAVGRLLLEFGTVIAILSSIVTFGAVIAAGWIGWPKPWLFGLMASVVGILLFAGIFAGLAAGPSEEPFADWFLFLVYREVVQLQPLFGLLAGWYGGYLRRRMAAAPSAAAARRRR
ncbi:MAG TPA: hypothetical protein VH859_05690 [Candidatus Limnocylindria bacterium]|jgi:hypothetical protein